MKKKKLVNKKLQIPPDGTKEKRGNPLLNLIKVEWEYLGDRRKTFVFYTILFTIANLIALSTPLIIGLIFNSIQESITSQYELRKLIFQICLLLAVNIVFWIFHGSARVLEEKTGFFVNRNYTNDKIKNVLSLPLRWHKDHHSGDTIDKINKGAGAISGFAQYTTFQVISGSVTIMGALIVLLFVDKFAALLAIIFSFGSLFVIFQFDKVLYKQYKELNKLSNKVSAGIFDYLSNIRTVITLRLRKAVSKEIDSRLMASYNLFKKNIVYNEIKWAFASISISLMTVIVLSMRAYRDYTTGVILIGTLYILYGYLERVGDTFYRFAELYGRLVAYDASVAGVNQIDEEYKKIRSENLIDLPEKWREIELKKITFAHNVESEMLHLDNVNMKFKKGQRIALIGESGSGKSTILSLIRGLDKPQKEKVLCDGLELDKGIARLKKHVTLIPQDPEIFNNTIKYNITLDFPVPSYQLEKAIEMAEFAKVVARLEKGLNTNVLEKGVSLSGGEKQRLALARGILAARDSEIVLMDEPTSSVDSLNEIKIYQNIFKEFKDKTIISSIHRLHLLKMFDYIYLFDKGKIIGEGTFEDFKKHEKFKLMWKKYTAHKNE